MAPSEPDAPPSGGGVTQLLKDTLTGPSITAADQARDKDKSQTTEKHAPGQGYKPDLSEVLPSDDAMVYGGEGEQHGCLGCGDKCLLLCYRAFNNNSRPDQGPRSGTDHRESGTRLGLHARPVGCATIG